MSTKLPSWLPPHEPGLTPWFPPHIKPVHPGVYETYFDGFRLLGYSLFNDGIWFGTCSNVQDASETFYCGSTIKKYWRGLARKP